MIHKVNVQDIKVTYPVGELKKCSPDDTALEHATKYEVHLEFMKDLHWFLNLKILLDLKDNLDGSPIMQIKGNQANCAQKFSAPDVVTKNATTCWCRSFH